MSRLGGVWLRLIGLALFGALPFVALGLFRLTSRTAHEEGMLSTEAERAAFVAAARMDERLRTADALLVGLSTTLRSDPSQRAANERTLKRTLDKAPSHAANLFVLDAAGTLVGTARPTLPANELPRAFVDRPYFKIAQTTRGLVVGELRQSAVLADSAWVIVLARALVDSTDEFRGLVAMPLRMDSLVALAVGSSNLDAPLVTIIDTSGTVVARSLEPESAVGQRRFDRGFNIDTSGTMAITGFDGVKRLTGFTRTSVAPWLVNVGIPQASLDARLAQSLREDLSLFLLAVALAVVTAYYVGQRITQPIAGLVNAAHAFERGDTGTRAAGGGPSEVRLLSKAFNQMAETVERRNAALADSERRYRLLFDSNPLPMWAWDADTMQIMAVNEAAVDKYGYSREQFLKLQVLDLLAPIEHTRFRSARLPFSESRQSAGTWMHQASDGRSMEMEVVTTSSRRLGRASWLSVGIDITARTEAERALARSEEQLRQSQKMEAIGTFAGGISHDFNNLLTGMLGYCDLALSELDENSDAYRDVAEVRALAVRGSDLTRQVLTVSRKQVVQPTRLNPNDVVSGLDRLLRRVVGAHIDFDINLQDDIGFIRADIGQLEQVLLNLTANARDAMRSGGTLRIATASVEGAHPLVRNLPGHMRWVMITVSDTGVGMTEAVRERIFEPFFTTKDRGKGTGLGLALVYAMVEQANGIVHVESEPNHGTTFQLLFPRVDGNSEASPAGLTTTEVLSGSETILFAEDEESVRNVATAALERHGYRVLSAANGDAALAILRAFPGHIDLLLTDVVMPGMNGRELALAVQQMRPDIKVVFASGYTDDEALLGDVQRNERTFVQKPFTTRELVQRIRSVLDQTTAVGTAR